MSNIILFEGIDGSGKTTIIGKLKEKLESKNKSVVIINGPVSKENVDKNIKNLADNLIDPAFKNRIKKINEILSYSLDRIDQFNLIKWYENSQIDYILVDRSFISAFAYQYNNMDDDIFNSINRQINFSLLDLFNIKFDYIIFINTPPSVAVERIKNRESSIAGKSEMPASDFSLEGILYNYMKTLEEIKQSGTRYFKKYFEINGDNSPETILDAVYEIVA